MRQTALPVQFAQGQNAHNCWKSCGGFRRWPEFNALYCLLHEQPVSWGRSNGHAHKPSRQKRTGIGDTA